MDIVSDSSAGASITIPQSDPFIFAAHDCLSEWSLFSVHCDFTAIIITESECWPNDKYARHCIWEVWQLAFQGDKRESELLLKKSESTVDSNWGGGEGFRGEKISFWSFYLKGFKHCDKSEQEGNPVTAGSFAAHVYSQFLVNNLPYLFLCLVLAF